MVGGVLILAVSYLFLPASLRDNLVWGGPHSHDFPWMLPLPFLLLLAPFICLMPLTNIPVMTPYKHWAWRVLEKKRQHAVAAHLSDEHMRMFPLPEISAPLPDSVSVCVHRNWLTTLIGGIIYAVVIGYVLLWAFVNGQENLLSLAQQGELSGWAFIGGIPDTLLCCLYLFPVLSAFLLAPRQRLIATQDGLMCYRGICFISIPWKEAQLFAVIAQQQETVVYEVSSRTSLIRWSSKPAWSSAEGLPSATIGTAPLNLIWSGNAPEEYEWPICQITAMAAARTGLPLYDLREQPGNKS